MKRNQKEWYEKNRKGIKWFEEKRSVLNDLRKVKEYFGIIFEEAWKKISKIFQKKIATYKETKPQHIKKQNKES